MFIIDARENKSLLKELDLMEVSYRVEEINVYVCKKCKKIYKSIPEKCTKIDDTFPEYLTTCDSTEFIAIKIADITNERRSFFLERKKGKDLSASLDGYHLYDQLERMMTLLTTSSLVFEGDWDELLSDPHNQARIGQIMSIPSTCYSDDTEILTKNRGWILFKDLIKEDEVACLRGTDKKFYWSKPIALQSYNYNGEMIHLNSRSIDLLVTPDHRLYVSKQYKSNFDFLEARNFNYGYFINSINWYGEEKEWFYIPKVKGINCKQINKILMDDWLEFLGWYIAEGCCDKKIHKGTYRIQITQIKENHLKEIGDCINKLGYKYKYNGHSFVINNKQLWSYLSKLGKSYEKYIPQEFMNLSKRQLEILFDNLIKGDGNISNNSVRYYTSSKKLADNFQELVIKLGCSCKIGERKTGFAKRINYSIFVKTSKKCVVRKEHISKKQYSGKVYCCTVPTGIILVRRNEKTTWCGNCAQYGVSFIQVKNTKELVKMLKYFDAKSGTEPKLRTQYQPRVRNIPKAMTLYMSVPGISEKLAKNIYEVYPIPVQLAHAIMQGNVKKIPKVGPKKLASLGQHLWGSLYNEETYKKKKKR